MTLSFISRRPFAAFLMLTVALGASACAAAGPTQSAAPVPVVAPPPPPVAAITEAPREWQLLDEAADQVSGISAQKAMRDLLANRQPARTVVVAVIDGGVDTAHVDLKPNIWTNSKETPGNGRDDDGNGYVDDVHGWNFIGGSDGRSIRYETLELTRVHAACIGRSAGAATTLTPALKSRCASVAQEYEKKKEEVEGTLGQISMIEAALAQAVPLLQRAVGSDSLTVDKVTRVQGPNADVLRAKQIYLQLAANGILPEEVKDARADYESQLKYGLNVDYNSRTVVGDDPKNLTQRGYGNRDVMGPDAKHGTHVAGIIGALRGNEGIDGIAPAVKLMSVRTVPDGDERDKDVANAIRYAVDQGANIINMSFGKGYSPEKRVVDDAVKYADSKGVLMIHAAGNDGDDLAASPSFPTATYEDGGRAQNWIEVGASTWKSADSLVAPFSNYGRNQVDVFAPGLDILSTVPGGGYERESGTSMAAPVVTGLAALIMSYYPKLTAAEVKRIILQSAIRKPQVMVLKPGSDGAERVPFATLSATGGIVNAYAALQMASSIQ